MKTIQDYIKFLNEEAQKQVDYAWACYNAGVNDCQAGVYDKWYRYNTPKDGLAYDLGWTTTNKEVLNEIVKFIENQSYYEKVNEI